jgi:hypothetical protein
MSFLARLFGWNRHKPDLAPSEDAGSGDESTFHIVGVPANGVSQADGVDQSAYEAAVQRAISPVVSELQILRRMIETKERLPQEGASQSPRPQAAPGVYTITQDVMERAIESALAHFYQLLRGREEFKAQPVYLPPAPDGNTWLPMDPELQHFLLVMHPLYPHMYTTIIVLPGTFTRVDRLRTLPNNGVRVHSLHINERKAAPGFMDAIRALHRANSENLFLGKLTPRTEERNRYLLEYFRCTTSEMRKADPERYPDDQMIFFNDVPEPLIIRQRLDGVDDVFSALRSLTSSEAAEPPDNSAGKPEEPEQGPDSQPDSQGETLP